MMGGLAKLIAEEAGAVSLGTAKKELRQKGTSKLASRASSPKSLSKISDETKRADEMAIREYAMNNGVSIAVARIMLKERE